MSVKISDRNWAELLEERIRAKDPGFQFWVGWCYYNEESIEKDYAESVKWFKLAVDQGHAIAQNNLAVCYSDGKGVAKDDKEALRLYNLSADQGYWGAFRNLGHIYRRGMDVERNREKALEYYEKALANAGHELSPASIADKEGIQKEIDKINAAIAEEERVEQERAKAAAEAQAKLARIAARTQVFISYARKDEVYRDELLPHLKVLERTKKVIKWWDDTQIKPGEKWDDKIKEALVTAKVAVLLVSANFIASDYVWREELRPILEAAKDEGATILWLPIKPCAYKSTEIAKYQAVTDPKIPLAKRSEAERDEVYTDLVEQIRGIFEPA